MAIILEELKKNKTGITKEMLEISQNVRRNFRKIPLKFIRKFEDGSVAKFPLKAGNPNFKKVFVSSVKTLMRVLKEIFSFFHLPTI